MIYLNKALVKWLPEKQSTIETYVLKAEVLDIKTGMETL